MKSTLFEELKDIKLILKNRYFNENISDMFCEDYCKEISDSNPAEEIKNIYRKEIIGKHSKNEFVRGNIEGNIKFYEIGKPIIERANKVYEVFKDKKRFGFKKSDILESSDCLEPIKCLEEIISAEKYFENGRVHGEFYDTFVTGMISESKLMRILPSISWANIGAIGGLVFSNCFHTPLSDSLLIGACCGIGIPSLAIAYEANCGKDTPETLIKKPAEIFGNDLKRLDDIFDRIYREVN